MITLGSILWKEWCYGIVAHDLCPWEVLPVVVRVTSLWTNGDMSVTVSFCLTPQVLEAHREGYSSSHRPEVWLQLDPDEQDWARPLPVICGCIQRQQAAWC